MGEKKKKKGTEEEVERHSLKFKTADQVAIFDELRVRTCRSN